MRSTGSRYLVRGDDGTLHECVAKGNLRVKGWKSTNPLAVGDRVDFLPQISAEEIGSIITLHDRKNYLVRRSVNLSHHKHVLAANLDQLLLIVTVARPRTSFGFIDRLLVTAEAYQVPAVVVFNKVDDLQGEDDLDLLAEYQGTYEDAGYRTLIVSAMKGVGMDGVKDLLAGKVTLLAGHSGVGKSTLINAIDPELDLWTLEISESSEKGQHTTTYAEMFELHPTAQAGAASSPEPRAPSLSTDGLVARGSRLEASAPTFIIDTPGVKGFGLVDMREDEIGDQFPEMFARKGDCRFNNCLHKEEPGCAVRKAVEEGTIAESRYRSYLDMLNGVEEDGPYRLD